MGGKVLGSGAAGTATAFGNAIDSIFTNKEERMQAQAMLDKIAQQPQVLQTEINKIEAAHPSLFVAGWRPAVGWVCVMGLAWNFLVQPLLAWTGFFFGVSLDNAPRLDITELMTILAGMLGLAGLRTHEKGRGVSR